MDKLIVSAMALFLLALLVFSIGLFWVAETEIVTITKQTTPCIEKQEYFDGHDWIQVWRIEGHWYLVRGNEIVGRYNRFYNDRGERR